MQLRLVKPEHRILQRGRKYMMERFIQPF